MSAASICSKVPLEICKLTSIDTSQALVCQNASIIPRYVFLAKPLYLLLSLAFAAISYRCCRSVFREGFTAVRSKTEHFALFTVLLFWALFTAASHCFFTKPDVLGRLFASAEALSSLAALFFLCATALAELGTSLLPKFFRPAFRALYMAGSGGPVLLVLAILLPARPSAAVIFWIVSASLFAALYVLLTVAQMLRRLKYVKRFALVFFPCLAALVLAALFEFVWNARLNNSSNCYFGGDEISLFLLGVTMFVYYRFFGKVKDVEFDNTRRVPLDDGGFIYITLDNVKYDEDKVQHFVSNMGVKFRAAPVKKQKKNAKF